MPKKSLRNLSKKSLLSFTACSQIDEGTFGVIYLVRKNGGIDDGQNYAMKHIICNPRAGKIHFKQQLLQNELNIFKLVVQMPFFTQLKYAWTTGNEFNFVMEYMPCGSLFDYVNGGVLSLDEAKICSAEILHAIAYLHENKIVYRDMKLENILVSTDGHILLTDFGLARKMETGQLLHDAVGTLEYFAPEILNRTGHSYEVDWWAFGVTVFELIVGHSPFNTQYNENVTRKELERRILNDEPHMEILNQVKDNFGDVNNLILKLLVKNREQRLGAGQNGYNDVKQHLFFLPLNWTAIKMKKYNCLRRHLAPNKIRNNLQSNWTVSMDQPKSQIEKYYHYIAPEFVEKELFYGFSEYDLINVPQMIPSKRPLHIIQMNVDTIIKTHNVTKALEDMIPMEVKVTPLLKGFMHHQNDENGRRKSRRIQIRNNQQTRTNGIN